MGQRSIGQFLEERARTRRIAENRRIAEERMRAGEAAALAKLEAEERKAARDIAAEKRSAALRRELKAIPQAKLPEDIALAKARTDKIRADLASPEGKAGGLSPAQELSLNKELKKSEELVIGNIDDPQSKPDMDFINEFGNKPYYYDQREVPGRLYGTNLKGSQIPLPVREINGKPTQLTMAHIREIAATEGMTIEQIINALGILGGE